MNKNYLWSKIQLILGLTLLISGNAFAELTKCSKISSIPAVVNSPGVYCLEKSFSTSDPGGVAITINSDDVVLDLGGFTLSGPGSADPSETRPVGILAENVSNVTVRDGTVENFLDAIILGKIDTSPPSAGNTVKNIRALNNLRQGMVVASEGGVVDSNSVINTASHGIGAAIIVLGAGSQVSNNHIAGLVEPTTSGFAVGGIVLNAAHGALIENNHISRPGLSCGFSTACVGIDIIGSENVLVRDNEIVGMTEGINFQEGGPGSSCPPALGDCPQSTGKYMHNLTINVTDPYEGSGGVAVDTND